MKKADKWFNMEIMQKTSLTDKMLINHNYIYDLKTFKYIEPTETHLGTREIS